MVYRNAGKARKGRKCRESDANIWPYVPAPLSLAEVAGCAAFRVVIRNPPRPHTDTQTEASWVGSAVNLNFLLKDISAGA